MTDNASNGILISPYGGKLVNLTASAEEREALIGRGPTISISMFRLPIGRTSANLELLATGGFLTARSVQWGRRITSVFLLRCALQRGTLFPIQSR